MDRLLPYNSRRSVVVLALLLGMIAAVALRSSANADGMPQAADPELCGRQAYHLTRHGEFRFPGPVEPELHRGPVATPLYRLPPQPVELAEVRLARSPRLAVVAHVDEHDGALPAQHLLDERGA